MIERPNASYALYLRKTHTWCNFLIFPRLLENLFWAACISETSPLSTMILLVSQL